MFIIFPVMFNALEAELFCVVLNSDPELIVSDVANNVAACMVVQRLVPFPFTTTFPKLVAVEDDTPNPDD